VAGTIGALRNFVGVVGVAPAATLCIYKVLSDSGSGKYSDVVAALQRAVADGVRITNNSYGSSGDPGSTVRAAFDNASNAGMLHIAAAGNSGNGRGTGSNCIYPALYTSVVATAATTTSDTRASFSSTCSDLELAAPGSQITSTTRNGGWGTMSGTSMASPHAAGVASLTLAANPGWSNLQVRQRLQQTAEDLGVSGRDTHFGYGLVRADTAAATVAVAPTGMLSGVVRSSPDGSAVAGAVVSVDTGQSVTTGSDGAYGIAGVPTGGRSVMASATGFDAQTLAATISEGQTTAVDFALNPKPATSKARIASISYTAEGGSDGKRHVHATVTLVDGSGIAVGGASISADLRRGASKVASFTGTTGTDGKVTFTLKNAATGCYDTIVTNVTASGLTWDGATPTNSFCK
jgi:hypothetical protein